MDEKNTMDNQLLREKIRAMVKYKHVAVIVLIAFAAGVLLDRATLNNGEKTRLVAGKTVKGTVYADFKIGD